jgi:Fe2+ transport system protein FeoA
MSHPACRPLPTIEPGAHVQVLRIVAGQRATRRLHDLGLVPGAALRMLQASGHGPLLLAVGDSRLAVERGIAQKVLVQPLPPHTAGEYAPVHEQEVATWPTP